MAFTWPSSYLDRPEGPPEPASSSGWDRLWAPYDPVIYDQALSYLSPGQHILDIGAGDLRFARRAAAKGCRVTAVELNPAPLWAGLRAGPLPDGLHAVLADARTWPFPPRRDAAVLLMRHCQDVGLYIRKLRATDCRALITNARWRLGVERVPLAPGIAFEAVSIGWYACLGCGATGFIPGEVGALTAEVEHIIHNVETCPACADQLA